VIGSEGPFSALLASFHRNRIAYCYWRGYRRIEAALAGLSDLDLLVAKQDQYRAQESLLRLGFKCFSTVGSSQPAISSFLGYDEASGRIVHVHLHVRLVIGGALVKTHRLHWETMVLARSVQHPLWPIRILDPADAALLSLVREALEVRRTDPVALRHWADLQRKFTTDREAFGSLDRATLLDRAREVFPEDLVSLIADAVFGRYTPAVRRRLRRGIRKNLSVWRLDNVVEQHARTAWRTVQRAAGWVNQRYLHMARPWRRQSPGGGCVVALVGVDGSGKTTVMKAIRTWLEPEVDVMPIYFGTGGGRPSVLLLPLKLMLPLVIVVLRRKPKGSSHGEVSDRPPGVIYSLLMMVWAGVLAVEKRMKLVAARRGAERGLVVIADRYAQDEETAYNDGPLLPRLTRAPTWLRRFEARAYRLARRLPPDLVIRLDVSAETIARREPDMNRAVIGDRIAALRRLRFPGARMVCVDGEKPLAEVLSTVKREIWQMI